LTRALEFYVALTPIGAKKSASKTTLYLFQFFG
jgi:hypothetical protein